jgi:hypothetical protein
MTTRPRGEWADELLGFRTIAVGDGEDIARACRR